MAEKITVEVFEKNLKNYNRKGLRRRYASVADHEGEYLRNKPIGPTTKYVFEALVDKEYVDKLQDFIKSKGFEILGASNYYFIDKISSDYHTNEELYSRAKDAVEAMEKDSKLMHENYAPYKEVQDGDVSFYFLPYNEKISNICEFIEEEKDSFLAFAKENDITIMINVHGFTQTAQGMIGFNYLDADKDDNSAIDFASKFVVSVDFSNGATVYNAAILLKGLADDAEDLELIGCDIIAENAR